MAVFAFLSLVTLLIASSATAACDRCVKQSKVAFYSNAQALQSGACGYGSLAIGFNGGRIAAAAPSIYNGGAGCGGSCFQIRCTDEKICNKKGTTVVVTDHNQDNATDFVLSSRAFTAMANKGMEPQVLKLGIVPVEYKRIPCDYKNKNLAVRVEEFSQKPHYLAIKLLYQGGQTEIIGIDVSQVGSSNWGYMSRNYGAVWDASSVPEGPLQLRFMVTAGYDRKMYQTKSVLPSNWINGQIYDTGIQINDTKLEGCGTCDDGSSKH